MEDLWCGVGSSGLPLPREDGPQRQRATVGEVWGEILSGLLWLHPHEAIWPCWTGSGKCVVRVHRWHGIPIHWPSESQWEYLRVLALLDTLFYGRENMVSALPTSRGEKPVETIKERSNRDLNNFQPQQGERSPVRVCFSARGVRTRPDGSPP